MFPFYNPYKINHVNVAKQKRKAANVVATKNPPYTVKDFLSFFPHFEPKEVDEMKYGLDLHIIEQYIEIANNNVNEGRWGSNWKFGMALFVAHLCSLHAQMVGTDPENPNSVANSSITGVVSSESVGDVSISYNNGSVLDDLEGWGNFKLTTYGSQFASMAQLITEPFRVIS